MPFIKNRPVHPQTIQGLGQVLTISDLVSLGETSRQRVYEWIREGNLPSHKHPSSPKDTRHYFKAWEVWDWAHRNIHPTASAVDRLISNMKGMAELCILDIRERGAQC